MKLKKLVTMACAGLTAMALMAGCGGSDSGKSASGGSADKKTAEAAAPAPASKTLVVYYSASGSTKAVAENIAKNTGADIFELVPKNQYTSADLNYNDKSSRVVKEHDDPALRDIELVSDKPANWENYDTVFVGYPIWWAIAAWPVDNFVKHNDFSGKRVIPFATAAVTDIGNSGEQLHEMAGTGSWEQGIRFYSNASASEVASWVDTLGIKK